MFVLIVCGMKALLQESNDSRLDAGIAFRRIGKKLPCDGAQGRQFAPQTRRADSEISANMQKAEMKGKPPPFPPSACAPGLSAEEELS
jgi:hypothetical protein